MLLQIQKQALETASQKELGFHAVNTTKKLVEYRRAIFWTATEQNIKLLNVSGNAVLDHKSPHAEWVTSKIKKQLRDLPAHDLHSVIEPKDLSKEETEEWLGYAAPCVSLFLFRYGDDDKVLGGLWLERETNFKEPEIQILNELSFYYTRALMLARVSHKREFLPLSDRLKPYRKYIWIFLTLMAFFPVQLTINAPAEVVAVSTRTVSVPFDGTLREVTIDPGTRVTEGYTLAEMDIETLSLQADTASEALKAAQTQLSRLRREVLSNPEKKAELNRLLSEIKTKEIEANYALSQLERAAIKSPRDGVAIFADKNDLKDKPVKIGQTIMQIADPKQTELLVRVPLQAMIPITEEAQVSFFSNASPLASYGANIQTIGYQASEDSDGLLTYKIRATFSNNPDDIRIGWKGVANIKGNWTILIYRILRRPLITLRSLTGM